MQKQQFHTNIVILIVIMLTFFVIGAFVFRSLEHWSFINAFYFVVMTATTVGYGDLTPSHNLSKIITIIYALSIIPFVIYTFSIIAKLHVERIYKRVYGIERKQNAQREELEKTEKRITENKKRLKEQGGELEKQEKTMKKQIKLDRKFEEEILEHDKELEVVEDVVEKELEKGKKK